MSKAAFWSLWCFVFVLPWDKIIVIPVLGTIPRIVGLVASAVGVVHVSRAGGQATVLVSPVRDTVCALGWGERLLVLDPQATGAKFLTYLQLSCSCG